MNQEKTIEKVKEDIFEIVSGSSTADFGARMAGYFKSLVHDPEWSERITDIRSCLVYLLEITKANHDREYWVAFESALSRDDWDLLYYKYFAPKEEK